ncbi:MAG: amidohydrolase [Verrucomicrobia bacterium]|nr:amidohydrolase [Verrucomicrobiota bacterium]MBM3869429.1 amidohydrolase [Verrucomicrobiota bacterium]
MTIDSHQHFWKFTSAEYPWMRPEWPIRRDFLPPDLAPLLHAAGLNGCVAVQAQQTVAEARWLLALADAHPFIRGVVGWVDLQSNRVEEQLAELARHPRFVGVRHVVQDEPDDNFMLRPAFQRGIGKLQQFNLAYDILVFPKQLPAAIRLVANFPEQRFVLDHIAKPPIAAGTLSPWREQLRELAAAPNVWCKVSGMVTEAEWLGWRADGFRPYLDVVFAAFGMERLMFGTDWPVCTLAGSYAQVHRLMDDYTSALTAEARAKFFGGNAADFYRLTG